MTGRHFEAAGSEYGIWSPKRLPTGVGCRRILVAHSEKSVGESIVLLFGIKGFAAMYARDFSATGAIVRAWEPQAVLFDTRLGRAGDISFIKEMLDEPENHSRLLVAMSGPVQEESIGTLQQQGFDGYCRRPCALWHLAELLSVFFAPAGEV